MAVLCEPARPCVCLLLLVSFVACALRQAGASNNSQPLFDKVPNTQRPCAIVKGDIYCFPDIYIVGFPKAGTSALWKKLGAHPRIVAGRKEHCPLQLNVSFESILEWASHYPKPGDIDEDKLVLNGCIGFHTYRGVEYFQAMTTQFGHADRMKAIVIMRDLPDWLYATWNYWCQPIDGNCSGLHNPNNLRQPEDERSPELFHSVISNQTEASRMPYHGYNLLQIWRALKHLSGGVQLLTVQQEDLFERPLEVLRRVEHFVGLPPHEYPPDVITSVFNAGSNPGIFEAATGDDVRPGAGREDMLPETRALLQRRFMQQCIDLHKEAGMCFATCCEGGRLREQVLDKADVKQHPDEAGVKQQFVGDVAMDAAGTKRPPEDLQAKQAHRPHVGGGRGGFEGRRARQPRMQMAAAVTGRGVGPRTVAGRPGASTPLVNPPAASNAAAAQAPAQGNHNVQLSRGSMRLFAFWHTQLEAMRATRGDDGSM